MTDLEDDIIAEKYLIKRSELQIDEIKLFSKYFDEIYDCRCNEKIKNLDQNKLKEYIVKKSKLSEELIERLIRYKLEYLISKGYVIEEMGFRLGKNAIFDLALIYEEAGDFDKAFKYYELAVANGIALSRYKLAKCYYYGLGTRINYNIAYELMESFAGKEYYYQIQDDALANEINFLAIMCFEGKAVKKNIFKGINILENGIIKGYSGCANALGCIYIAGKYDMEGISVNCELENLVDEKKGYFYFKRAMNMGNYMAALNVAECYLRGDGVEKSDIFAIKYFLKAINMNADSKDILDFKKLLHEFGVTDEDIDLYKELINK